jgi:hypothetical protein
MRPKFCISRKKQQYLKQSLTLRFSHELHFVEQGRRIPQNARRGSFHRGRHLSPEIHQTEAGKTKGAGLLVPRDPYDECSIASLYTLRHCSLKINSTRLLPDATVRQARQLVSKRQIGGEIKAR